MRILLIALMLFVSACDDIKIVKKKSTRGYKAYVVTCIEDTKNERQCRCQADILRQDISDDKMGLIASAAKADRNKDTATLKKITTEHPELITTLKLLSRKTEDCNNL